MTAKSEGNYTYPSFAIMDQTTQELSTGNFEWDLIESTTWAIEVSTDVPVAGSSGSGSSLQIISIILNTILIILSLWIIASNLTLIIAVAKNTNLRRVPYTFIASLAMTDVLNGLLGGGIVLSFTFYVEGNFNKTLCHANGFIVLFPMLCSRFHLIIIGLDKLVSIVQPLR